MKKFFSSTYFKCISVLLAIALVAGGLLAILNDVLYVSTEERTMRAIKKIYGEEKEYQVVFDVDETEDKTPFVCGDYGVIEKVFTVGDTSGTSYDMLFYTTGNKGYKNGSITLWLQIGVQVSGTDKTFSVEKIIMESFTKQTLMSKLGDGYYSSFSGEISGDYFSALPEDKDPGKIYKPVTGATKSATAACNAVNCVIFYLTTEGVL